MASKSPLHWGFATCKQNAFFVAKPPDFCTGLITDSPSHKAFAGFARCKSAEVLPNRALATWQNLVGSNKRRISPRRHGDHRVTLFSTTAQGPKCKNHRLHGYHRLKYYPSRSRLLTGRRDVNGGSFFTEIRAHQCNPWLKPCAVVFE